MKKNDTVDTLGGNTKKPQARHRGYLFTWNNPDYDTDFSNFLDISGAKIWIYQLERGENDTEHYQGVVYYENARSFDSMKKLNREIHWEGVKDLRKAIKYCCKEDTRVSGPWSKGIKIPKSLNIIEPRGWQKELVEELKQEADDRTIIWYYDKNGGQGKTVLSKYLVVKMNAIVVSGKASDIKYAVGKTLDSGKEMEIVIFLFPRSVEEYVSYDAIESVKDGIFFNGKYESGMHVFPSPHVVCFANFKPDLEKLSIDRWDVRTLN